MMAKRLQRHTNKKPGTVVQSRWPNHLLVGVAATTPPKIVVASPSGHR
jgi:hypothetical protein